MYENIRTFVLERNTGHDDYGVEIRVETTTTLMQMLGIQVKHMAVAFNRGIQWYAGCSRRVGCSLHYPTRKFRRM
jgi:hypothetical protein